MSIERNNRADKHVQEITRIFHQRADDLRREVTMEYVSKIILPEGFGDEDLELAKEILERMLR